MMMIHREPIDDDDRMNGLHYVFMISDSSMSPSQVLWFSLAQSTGASAADMHAATVHFTYFMSLSLTARRRRKKPNHEQPSMIRLADRWNRMRPTIDVDAVPRSEDEPPSEPSQSSRLSTGHESMDQQKPRKKL